MLIFPELFSLFPPSGPLNDNWTSRKQCQGFPSLDTLVEGLHHTSSCSGVGTLTQLPLPKHSGSTHPVSFCVSPRSFLDRFRRPSAMPRKSDKVRHLYVGPNSKGRRSMVTIRSDLEVIAFFLEDFLSQNIS